MNSKFGPIFAGLAMLLFVLAGCGGGGGGGSTPAETATPATADKPQGPTGTASISGTISYEGAVPELPVLDMGADPGCAAKHEEAPVNEMLVLGDGNTMGNVLVRVTGGLPDASWSAPSEPVVMDQNGCMYDPHVMSVMVGQPFKILNSDGLLHNVNAQPNVNTKFNMAMPAIRTEAEKVFDKSEDPFFIKCDVHPWMGAYVAVSTHPFFAVTAKDGRFTISDLPAGEYTIEAWHERLGTQTATVAVAEGESQMADFTFTRPQ